MSRGHQDWLARTSSRGSVDNDTNELVARLGSPYTYFRSGKVLWQTNFSRDFVDTDDISVNGNATFKLDNEKVFFGNQSLKAISGDNIADNVVVRKRLPYTGEHSIGVQYGFLNEDNLILLHEIDFNVWLNRPNLTDDTNIRYFERIKFRGQSHEIVYEELGTDFPLCDGMVTPLPANAGHWTFVKCVFDLIQLKTDYIRINYDVCNINKTFQEFETNEVQQMTISITLPCGKAGDHSNIWLDHIIITQDEDILN